MTSITAIVRTARLLAFAAMLPLAAQAQPQPPDVGTDVDPPTRVARLSYVNGRVSFSPAGNDTWVEARVNRPIVGGDRLWSDADSRVELAIDDSTWWLGDNTSLAVSNLDDRIVQMQVQEGVVDLRVRRLPSDNIVEIDTPNLAFSVTRPGRYRVEVDPQEGSTLVVVRDGGGEVYGEGGSYVIASRQAYRFYGTDVADSEFVDLPPLDALDRFASDRDREYASAASLRYVSPDVIGYEDLDRYGSWTVEATYGNVWFPRQVSTDWAPYREGHWAWIDPWGWTWVDDQPWGFAPFHYGRWAHFPRGWGWVPGPRAVRAVYAPALVVFVGGAGFSVGVSTGPAIGWFPLAPREVYVPPYRVSRNYFRQVNVTNTVVNVTNVTNIYNDPGRISQIRYANRAAPNAVTAVPPAAFAQAQSVRRAAIPIPAAAVQRAEVRSVAPVAPARPAFVGAAPAAQVRPPAAAVQRPVVARTPPPPPPVPDAQKIQLLEKNPGRPLTHAEVQTLRRSAPSPAPAMAPAPAKVVTQAKPPANATPPARAAGTRRAPQSAGSPPPPGTAAPPPQGEGRAPTPPPASAEPPRQGQRRATPSAPPATPASPGQGERRAPEQATPALPGQGEQRAPVQPGTPAPPGQAQRRAPAAAAPAVPPSSASPEAAPAPAPPARSGEGPSQRRSPEARPQPQPAPQPAPGPEARPPQAARPAPAPPQPQPEAARRPEAPRPPPQAARPAPAPPQPQPEAARRPEAPRPPPQAARPAPPQPQPEAARRPEAPRPPPQAARPAPSPPPPQPEAARRPEQPQPKPPAQRRGNEKDEGKGG